MAAIVSGNSLGLLNTSLYVLGGQAGTGQASQGRTGERVYVNAVTGNLVLQNTDEVLLGRGPDVNVLRTYNSQGLLTDDNGDNWRLGLYRKVYNLTGTANAAGSTVARVAADGSESVYAYDATRALYVNSDGAGAFDTISYAPSTQLWTFTDGATQAKELYDGANGGRITQLQDTDGNSLTLTYNAAGLIAQVTDASGESTFLDYTGTNLTDLRTVTSGGQTLVRTRYTYDASNRLTQVVTDLSPADASVADANTYAVSYAYDGASTRVARMTQSDGTSLAFTYVQTGASFRVASITDALGQVTSFAYDTVARTTTVTDPLGLASTLAYDAAGELTQITAPAVGGISQTVAYAYDAAGNVTSVTDAKGNVVTYQYDANGNRTLERDAAGNTVTRLFGAKNELLAETTYLVPDPDGAGAGQPGTPLTARYAYDANNHLRFAVSADGKVTEYRYNGFGQRVAAIQYSGARYDVSALTPAQTLTQAQLVAWLPADKSASLRTDTAYDFRGQVASTTTYAKIDAAGNGVTDGTQAIAQYVYDQAGNLLRTIDPRGSSTTYAYDGLGRLLSSVDALGATTLTQYGDANRKTVMTLANGLVATSTYDAAGNLASVVQSSGGVALGETDYFYDADARLRRSVDPTGVQTHILYDAAGRKIAAIDGTGSLTEYRYDADNDVTRTIRYATAVSAAALASLVDASGKPTNVALASIRPATSTADRVTFAAYDAANRLVKSVDEAGFVTQTFYDGAGRATDVVRYATPISTAAFTDTPAPSAINPTAGAADRLSRFFYDADGRIRGTLDGEGFLVEYKYDAAGELVETVGYATATNAALRTSGTLAQLLPAASAADIHSFDLYNARGQLAAMVDGEGFLTETVYDTAGNKTQIIRYATRVTYTAGATLGSLRPAPSAQDQVTTFGYTALNQLASQTNIDGTLTQYTYDAVGNLTQTLKAVNTSDARTVLAQYDKQGRLTAQLSANGATLLTGNQTQAQIDAIWAANAVKYTYDAAGRRTSATDADGHRTLYFYNADGSLTHTVNALGEVAESVYNALGQVTQVARYGTRLSAATLATLSGGLVNATLTSALAALANPSLDSKTSYAYNVKGRLAQTTDALGNAITQAFDAFGDMTTSSQAIGGGLTLDHIYSYDRRGLLSQTVWDPSGLATSSSTVYDAFGRAIRSTDARGNVTTASYDKLGHVVVTTDPLNQSKSATYDAFGRTLAQTDALGKTTTYNYDTANRKVIVTTPEGITTTTVKNRHGQTIAVTDGRGNTTSYQYDRDGNLVRTDAPAAGTTTRSYDAADLLIDTVDANGTHTAYAYDAANRVITRTQDPGAGHLNLVTAYAYDAKGQAISTTDANGVVTQTQFDLKGQTTSVVVDPGAGHLNLTTTYSYDARGKTLTRTEGAGSASPRVTQYGYDKLGRLLQTRVDPAGINATTTYTYDKNGNVGTKVDADGNSTLYAYDADDRLVYTVNALGGVSRSDYDADGRVTRVTGYANAINRAGLSATPSVADVAARVVTGAADETKSYVYDGDGREIFCIDALGDVTQKSYDGNGNLARSVQYANPIPTTTALTPAAVAAALSPSAGDRVTRTVYDAADRAVYAIDAAGQVQETQYDSPGQITRTIQYTQPISVGATPSIAEVAAALGAVSVPVSTVNTTSTLFANPVQPYTYSASAQNDVAAPATQTVAVTNTGQTNSTPPVQPYTYVASAKSDVASPLSQSATLTVQNTAQTQSGNVANYAWVNSRGTLVQTTGVSIVPGYVGFNDTTPTLVRATIRRADGSLYAVTTTDVGSLSIQTDESGNNFASWAGVSNWGGQVNLSTGAMPAGNYTVVLEARDEAAIYDGRSTTTDPATGITAFWNDSDGTWAYSNTISITIGTVAGPTTVTWPASLQPAGTTASFRYRPSGSTGAYTTAAVSVAGANDQVSLGTVAAGNYDYIIQYKDSFGRVLKSAAGTLTTATAQTTSAGATFSSTQVSSSVTAGSSISGYIPLTQVSTIDRVSATVTDIASGLAVSSNVLTYPEFEANYNGEVNLKLGSQLANGRYNVAITVFYKNGTVENKPVFLYEIGGQNGWILHTVSWAASTAPAGTTATFGYRASGSTGAFTNAAVTTAGANQQVALDHIAAGSYEYQLQFKDGFGRVLKSAASTFTVTGSGSSTTSTTFSFTQVTSTAATGSSITGYITAAEAPAIDFVDATVRDLAGNVVSTARTYPEFEPAYNGRVNLRVGSVLADGGKYNVTIVIHKKNGTLDSRPAFYYEVGPQPFPQRTTTLSWQIPAVVAGATAQFTYAPAGSSTFASAPVTQSGANHGVSLLNVPDGSYTYFVSYFSGGQLLRQASGTFSSSASGTVGGQLQFQLPPASDPQSGKQVNSFVYDAVGRLVSSTDAEGYTESYAYDALGNRTSFTNKNGSTWNYVYDAAGRMLSELSPQVGVTSVSDSAGAITATSGAARIETRMTYDAFGNVLSRTEAYGRPEARTTQYQYDALGRQVRTIFPTVNVYNAAADDLTTNGIAGTVARTETAFTPQTTVSYDGLGNAIIAADAAGNTSTKVYDGLGRVQYEIDAEHFVTQYGYDSFGNQTSLTRYATALNFGAVAGFAAHAEGGAFTAAEVAARLAPSAADRVIRTSYDALNRATQVVQPSVFTFDSSATGASPRTFTAGATARNTYNAFDQLVKQSVLRNPGTDLVVGTADDTWIDTYFYYDRRGSQVGQIDALGYFTESQYDAEGNLTRQIQYAQALAAGSWSVSGHAAPVATTPQSNPNAAIGYDRQTDYQYDRKNQLIAQKQANVEIGTVSGALALGTTVGNPTTFYRYDGVGNQTSVTDPTGATTYTYYDVLGRAVATAAPARVSDPSGAVTLVPLTTLEHDVFGNVVRTTSFANSAARADATGYAAPAASAADQVTLAAYDTLGHLVHTIDPEGASRFTSYDALGHAVKSWMPITNNDGQVNNAVQVFRYDALGHHIATVEPSYLPFQPGTPLNPAAFATTQVQYDAFGEIVAKGLNGLQEYYHYDNAGHLWRTNQNRGVNEVFLYDTQGKATSAIVSQTIDLLNSFSSAAQVAALTANVERTDTKYDSLERAVQQVAPSFTVQHATLEAYPVGLGLTNGALSVNSYSAAHYDSGEFGFVWNSGNSISLGWNDLSLLGGGNVLVTVDYINANGSAGAFSQEFASSLSASGVSMSWDVDERTGGDFGTGTGFESRVRVWKRDVSGNLVAIFDQAGTGSTNNLVTADAGAVTAANVKSAASSTWTPVAIYHMGNRDLVNTLGWAAGTYDVEVQYTRYGDSLPYAHATGRLANVGGGITNTTTAVDAATVTATPTTTQTLDRWGNALAVTDARGNTTSYRYNFLDNMVEQDAPFTDVWSASAALTRARPVTRGFYDAMGRSLGTIDANGNPTTEFYNAAGQLIMEFHADGGMLSYQYNALGQLVRSTDALGHSTFSSYDHDGRLAQLSRPTGTETYAYDQAGNRIRSTDAAGATTRYWYDTRGKLIRSQLPGGQQTGEGYDLRGNKIAELNANGDAMSWSYDYFGKLLSHTDLGGAAYSYSYDLAGDVTQQVLTRGASGSVTTFQYYENGALKRSYDSGIDDDTSYEYDVAGNRTRSNTRVGAYVEDDRIAYDELGRIKTVQGSHLPRLTYRYDAVGNRRNVNAVYFDGNGAQQTADDWYVYDSMNRTVLSQGVLVGGAGGTIQTNGSQGVQLQYDAGGNRRTAITATAAESYAYDAGNRLISTVRNNVLVNDDAYDSAGRMIQQRTFDASTGGLTETRQNAYNANGWITQQAISNGAGALVQSTNYTGYDGLGNVTSYSIFVSGAQPGQSNIRSDGTFLGVAAGAIAQSGQANGLSYTNFYSLSYAKFDVYKENMASGTSTYFEPGTTTTAYDIDGNVVSVVDSFGSQQVGAPTGQTDTFGRPILGPVTPRTFVTDSRGEILQKTDNGKTQRFFYADGKPIGTSGALSGANFDYNYSAVSQQYPNMMPTSYTVNRGDTLRSIAAALLGDASLWYMIADANGVASDAGLQPGMHLTIPNRVLNIHNDYQTFKVYNPPEVVGDVTPNLPAPPPPPPQSSGGCGIFGIIIVAIVAIVVTVITAGAALAFIAPEATLAGGVTVAEAGIFAAGTAALTGGVTGASVLAVAGAAAIGGAVGSIASQGLGIALGIQQKFSWGAVAAAGLSAGVTAGIGAGLGQGGIAGALQVPSGVGQQALNGAVNNAISQGINILTGQQQSFDWRGVAAAAVVAPLSQAISGAFGKDNPIAAGFASRFVGGIASGAIKAALGGKVDFAHVAADAFGNAIGNAITDSLAMQSTQQALQLKQAQQQAAQPAEPVPLPQGKPPVGVAPETVEQQQNPIAEVAEETQESRPIRIADAGNATDAPPAWAQAAAQGAAEQNASPPPPEAAATPSDEEKTRAAFLRMAAQYGVVDPDGNLIPFKGPLGPMVEVTDFDAEGNPSGTKMVPDPAWGPPPMPYGEQMWHVGQVVLGIPMGIINGVPKMLVGLGTLMWESSVLQSRLDLGDNLDDAYKTAKQSVDGWWDGTVVPYSNKEQAMGGFVGEFISPSVYAKGFQVAGMALNTVGRLGEIAPAFEGGTLSERVFAQYQSFVDNAYSIATRADQAGMMEVPWYMSKEQYIGALVDADARANLRLWAASQRIDTDVEMLINRRLSDPAGTGNFRVPDVNLPGENWIFDATLSQKTLAWPQIQGFYNYSGGATITIVRPGELGGSYSLLPWWRNSYGGYGVRP